MSFRFSDIEDDSPVLKVENLLKSMGTGAIAPQAQSGRRSRKRNSTKRLSQTALLAPILAAEGCFTFRPVDSNLVTPAPSDQSGGANLGDQDNDANQGGAPAPAPVVAEDDRGFTGESGQSVMISTAALLKNDAPENGAGLEVVRVFNAKHGAVMLHNGDVHFTPADGFEGVASFSYEARDANGNLTEASVEIEVTPAADQADDNQNDGHGADDHDHGDDHQDDASNGDADNADSGHDSAHDGAHDGSEDPSADGGHDGAHDGAHDDTDGGAQDAGGAHDAGHDTGHSNDGSAADPHAGHGSDDGAHAHPDDPAKAAEHMAALALATVADATHIATSSGSWFDPAIWANGVVPGDGAKVVIPSGVTVDYDGQSPASLFTVRVDGDLKFATDVDTFMEVDTLLVSPSGHMQIGTLNNPVAAGVEAIIQIADNGPIDVAWDPMLLSRGIVSHGAIEAHGAEKDAFLKLAVDPMAGDTSLTLEEAPAGWKVGDKLVLTGTKLTDYTEVGPGDQRPDITTQDEELTIVAINGSVIQFDKPLEFDHDSPRADLKAYVANYTRNIRIQMENHETVPVHERGHTMFMHSDDVDVRYVEFFELGRTDKSERAFDVGDLATVASDSNVKGRYAVHFHRTGVENIDDPAILVGNSVWGSPGWGFVHHDSNAILTDNAAYDVFGAAFVAETGNEIGRWAHNIAIKSEGVSGGPKWHEDVLEFDLGRTGAGFWFQGRLVDAVDNVAAGVPAGHGFVYMTRGWGDDLFKVTPDILEQPETLRYLDEAFAGVPTISQFDGNESIATDVGLEVIKAGATQQHDARSVISDFTAWEVRTGVHLQYTAHYTLQDLDLIAAATPTSHWGVSAGIQYSPQVVDIVVNGADVTGFNTGVKAARDFNGLPVDTSTFDPDYVFIDLNISGSGTQDFENILPVDRILTSADIASVPVSFVSDIADLSLGPNLGEKIVLSGEKTDGLGTIEVSSEWDVHKFDWFSLRGAVEEEGYWSLPDGRNVTVVEQFIADRVTGELIKHGVVLEIPSNSTFFAGGGFVRVDPVYHGEFDLTNDAPIGNSDFATVSQGSSVTINVIANDTDPDGDSLSVDGFIQPDYGYVVDNGDGTVTYTPDPIYVGEDTFYYWVEDGAGHFSKAEVQITVDV